MPFVALAEVFRLRGRVLLVITALAAFLLFWPLQWGGDRLGLSTLRSEDFLWVIGAVLLGFGGLVVTRVFDWIDDRRKARKQFDNVLLELRSRRPAERKLLVAAIQEDSSTVEVDWQDREHAAVLVSKGLLEKVVEPRRIAAGTLVGRYTIPTAVWSLMRGNDPEAFFEDIDENRGKFLRQLMLGSLWGPTIEFQLSADVMKRFVDKMKAVNEHLESTDDERRKK